MPLTAVLLGVLVWTVLAFAMAPVMGHLLSGRRARIQVLIVPAKAPGAAMAARDSFDLRHAA